MSRTCQRCNHDNTPDAKFCLQCGAMLEQDAVDSGDPLIGKILEGRYRVIKVIGEGGMGKVYLAEQKMGTATRKVAVKTLHPELIGDPQLVARFHRESATVIELQHPNTINFYDFGELDDKTLFIVMEFIEGEALADVLARGPLDPGRVDKILIQICGSLNEAHQIGVVHRDLKPENVLLTNRGGQTDFVKVLDFGIAKRSEAEDESQQKLTKQGMVLGTPPYMSPEQFSGQALDARSDIYSLGIMTFEMLTGTLPFEAKTPWEWATKHLTAQPKPLSSFPNLANLAENKRATVMRALAKNRDERQSTALEFLQSFTGYQDAQSAWTMATSSTGGSIPRASETGATPTPRTPVGTPGPMPQSGTMPAPNVYNSPPQGTYGGVSSNPTYDSMELPQRGGGAGKIIAILVIMLFVVGGGAAGGLYWWSQQGDPGDVGGPIANAQTQTQTTGLPVTGTATQVGGNPMVPSTPNTEVTMDTGTPTMDVAPTPEDPPTEVETTPPTMETPTMDRPSMDRPSMASMMGMNSGAGSDMLRRATAAIGRHDVAGAVSALSRAQAALGRSDSGVRRVRTSLTNEGYQRVGVLLQQGRCSQAQQLYRQLSTVGAQRRAASQFSPDWCRQP
ncbi:MAG: serine/threonine protein kinase [Deltaproteobacteria bacterium]|nr:MAG: serine/threonine protein kinase [Deltaproteobacteria bacterium]